jgi:hypothetical protein
MSAASPRSFHRPLAWAPSSLLVLFAACAGGPVPTAGNDPWRGRKFPPLTADQLRTGELPEGYRLGDLAGVPPADRPTERQERWSQTPNEQTFGVWARGLGRIDHVQWMWPDASGPAPDLLDAAGITLGPAIAVGRGYNRDWGRLSQGHTQGEYVAVVLFETNRPELFVQLRCQDRRLDSLTWCSDRSHLFEVDRRVGIAEALQQLEAAVTSGAWKQVSAWCAQLAAAGEPAVLARVAAARAKLRDHQLQHDAPIVAELAQLDARRLALAGADVDRRLRGWAELLPRAAELHGKLQLAESDVLKNIAALWTELVRVENDKLGTAAPEHVVGWFWRWAARRARTPEAALTAWVHAHELDAPEVPYQTSIDTRLRLGAGEDALLPLGGDADRTARTRMVAKLRHLAAFERGQGRGMRATWLEQVPIRDLEQLVPASDLQFPYLNGAEFLNLWSSIVSWDNVHAGDVQIRVRTLCDLLDAELRQAEARQKRTLVTVRSHEAFLRGQLALAAAELRNSAATAAGSGWIATAVVLELQADSALGETAPDVMRLGAAPGPGAGAVRHGLSMLATVLPAIDADTAQAERLCELLAEGEAATWPIVRHLAVAVRPGDVPAARAAAGLPVRHAHLARNEAGGVVLVERDRPSDPRADERFWREYSGRSEQTLQESAWIRSEASWLEPEKKWLDEERAAMESLNAAAKQEHAAIEAEFAAAERQRATINQYDQAAIAAFNDGVLAREQRRQAYNKQAEGLQQRTATHTERTAVFNRRVGEFNRRLSKLNERRMREDAAGAVALDGMLWPPLRAAVLANLETWVAARRQQVAAGPELDHEVRMARWLFGQEPNGPELARRHEGAGCHRLMAAAALRLAPRQSTNEAYAGKIAEYCLFAWLGGTAERDDALRPHLEEFVRRRDWTILKKALENESRLSVGETVRLLQLLEQRRKEAMAPSK